MGYEAEASATRGHALDSARVSGSERDRRPREGSDDGARGYISRSTEEMRMYERPERRRGHEDDIIREEGSVLEGSTSDREGGPRARAPGLFDPPPGTDLSFPMDGHTCGGHPDRKGVLDMSKLLKFDDKEKFLSTDTPMQFIIKHRKLMNGYTDLAPDDDLPTYISFFCLQSPDHQIIHDELKSKKAHFTSFEHYMREFQTILYPTLKTFALQELRKCKQQQKEDVMTYFKRTADLLKMLQMDQNSHCDEFISGLRDEFVRNALKQKSYGVNDEGMKLKEMAHHASQVEARDKCSKTLRNMDGRQKDVSSVNDKRKSMKQGQGQDKPDSEGQKKKQNQQSSGQGQSQGQQGQSSTHQAKGNRPWQRKPYNKDKDKIKKSVQEVSAEEPDARYKNFNVAEISKHFAEVIPADELKRRCLGCLDTTHRWKGNFKNCPPACPFCGTKFDSTNGHCAPECKKLPKTPAAIFKVVDA